MSALYRVFCKALTGSENVNSSDNQSLKCPLVREFTAVWKTNFTRSNNFFRENAYELYGDEKARLNSRAIKQSSSCIYLLIIYGMFSQDSFFSFNELFSMRVLAFLAKHLQRRLMEITVISNYHHRRPHKGIELGTFRY